MKKHITCIVIFILLLILSIGACAEKDIPKFEGDFTVRNGIRFGMTLSEVDALEKAYGTTTEYKADTSEEDYNPTNYSDSISYYPITLLDYPSSQLFYYFDSSEKLISLGYQFGSASYVPDVDSVHSEMRELLVSKYGEPYLDDGSILSERLVSSLLSDEIYVKALYNMFGQTHSIYNVSQWLIEYDGYYVIIDLFDIYNGKRSFCHMGYRRITANEIQDSIAQDKSEKAQKSNDI